MSSPVGYSNTPERLGSVWLVAIIVWLGIMVATPIALWLLGDPVFPLLASLGVLAQLIAVLLTLAQTWSIKRVISIFVAVSVLTWGLEVLGVLTGFPFGSYTYTNKLQPQIAGVPLLIPLAWLMMLAPAWGLSSAILHSISKRLGKYYWIIYSALSGLAFTAWYLYLDPQMVSRDLWTWLESGRYFGIPMVNFFGWWLGSSLITMLIRPNNIQAFHLWLIYALTWLLQAIGMGIFWGQAGAALAGLIGMGLFVLLAYQGLRRDHGRMLELLT